MTAVVCFRYGSAKIWWRFKFQTQYTVTMKDSNRILCAIVHVLFIMQILCFSYSILLEGTFRKKFLKFQLDSVYFRIQTTRKFLEAVELTKVGCKYFKWNLNRTMRQHHRNNGKNTYTQEVPCSNLSFHCYSPTYALEVKTNTYARNVWTLCQFVHVCICWLVYVNMCPAHTGNSYWGIRKKKKRRETFWLSPSQLCAAPQLVFDKFIGDGEIELSTKKNRSLLIYTHSSDKQYTVCVLSFCFSVYLR